MATYLSILTMKRQISRAQFEKYVSVRAYYIWLGLEKSRRERNWYIAEHELGHMRYIHPSDPRHRQLSDYARDVVYPRFKDQDARADRREAEQYIAIRYAVRD